MPHNSALAPLVALTVLAAVDAQAQQGAPPTCPPQVFRWAEDCSALAGAARKGVDALRYIPLDAGGTAWATFGGEYRLRVDALSDPDFGIGAPASFTALSQRAYAHIDVRTRHGPRVFAQLSAADEDGREPGPRTVDESDVDLAQLFIDAPLGALTLRAGRQELDLGANRLVSLRDAALRRTFDGVEARLALGRSRLTAFYVRPVVVKNGAFDDSSDRTDTFSGAVLRLPDHDGRNTSFFAFDRRRDRARTFSVSGAERRQTYGARLTWRDAHTDGSAQAAIQDGAIAGRTIRAFGATLDAGRRFDTAWAPRVGVTLGYAGGDDDASDGTLGTFDPLYPNLSTFTEAPLYYPTNQINAELNLTTHPADDLTLRLNAILLARASTDDAIYASSGRVLAAPVGDDRLSATLLEVTARWTVTPRVDVYGAIAHADALDAVRTAGGGDTTYGLLQLTTKF